MMNASDDSAADILVSLQYACSQEENEDDDHRLAYLMEEEEVEIEESKKRKREKDKVRKNKIKEIKMRTLEDIEDRIEVMRTKIKRLETKFPKEKKRYGELLEKAREKLRSQVMNFNLFVKAKCTENTWDPVSKLDYRSLHKRDKLPEEDGSKCLCAKNGRECFINECSNSWEHRLLCTLNTCSNPESKCHNRMIPRGKLDQLKIVEEEGKGFSVKTTQALRRDEFIGCYVGKVYKRSQPPDDITYTADLSNKTLVDGRRGGNISKFINHSCEPNLYVYRHFDESRFPRLAIFAKKHIKAGEMLYWNYFEEGATDSDDKDNDNTDIPFSCNCGSTKCKFKVLKT